MVPFLLQSVSFGLFDSVCCLSCYSNIKINCKTLIVSTLNAVIIVVLKEYVKMWIIIREKKIKFVTIWEPISDFDVLKPTKCCALKSFWVWVICNRKVFVVPTQHRESVEEAKSKCWHEVLSIMIKLCIVIPHCNLFFSRMRTFDISGLKSSREKSASQTLPIQVRERAQYWLRFF